VNEALLEQLLENDEGSGPRDAAGRLKPYRDSVGKLTIGYGRNLDDRGITEVEALYLLHNDVVEVEHDLDQHLPWWRGLDDVRQRVLADMAFNMGLAGLLTFHQTIAFIQAGQYPAASAGMLNSRWARQVGRRARRLAQMMETGQDVPLSEM